MCTVALRFADGTLSALLVRDEAMDRPSSGYGAWWPDLAPGVVGSQDLLAGGTAAALDLPGRRFASVLNGPDEAPREGLLTRGRLPLDLLRGLRPGAADLARTAPHHLLLADRHGATIDSWVDGRRVGRRVTEGDHVIVNGGLDTASDPRCAAVQRALSAVPDGPIGSPVGWEAVVAAAVVPPTTVGGRPYGTVALACVLIAEDCMVAQAALPLPADPLPWVAVRLPATKAL